MLLAADAADPVTFRSFPDWNTYPGCVHKLHIDSHGNSLSAASKANWGFIQSHPIWVCLKMSCTPLYPMVLLIIIPMKNGYFIGNIPNIFRHTQISSPGRIIQTASGATSPSFQDAALLLDDGLPSNVHCSKPCLFDLLKFTSISILMWLYYWI